MWNTLAVCAQEVWVLAYYDDSSLYIRCKDYFENDASLIHPTEVTRWDCEDDDGDYTREDVVETECGCPSTSSLDTTPSPTTPETTPAPLTPTLAPYVAVPSACGATESFRITSVGLPEVEGCFQATDESFSNPGATFEIWSVSGNTQFNQVVILGVADDGTGEVVSFKRKAQAKRCLFTRSACFLKVVNSPLKLCMLSYNAHYLLGPFSAAKRCPQCALGIAL